MASPFLLVVPGLITGRKRKTMKPKQETRKENERQQQSSSHSKLKAAQKSVAARVKKKVKDQGQIGWSATLFFRGAYWTYRWWSKRANDCDVWLISVVSYNQTKNVAIELDKDLNDTQLYMNNRVCQQQIPRGVVGLVVGGVDENTWRRKDSWYERCSILSTDLIHH